MAAESCDIMTFGKVFCSCAGNFMTGGKKCTFLAWPEASNDKDDGDVNNIEASNDGDDGDVHNLEDHSVHEHPVDDPSDDDFRNFLAELDSPAIIPPKLMDSPFKNSTTKSTPRKLIDLTGEES